ncbi:nitroreductase family protein [Cellulosilyticum sp. I15G10I2]|uniref:nitroreductase family protein n=1 Tax=Cellulosilyticum sp. I15G10I2 TaxID=1892843 RepID=UPI00085BC855|nr:nitroreductase family protein [Cellulosilyticum sp. I15G10I2]
MTNTQLFNTISKRKSIRKYTQTPLTDEVLTKVKEYANNARPLDASIGYAFSYISEEHVKNLLPIKAPHYICLFSEEKEGYLMNAGYLLQQIDLYLSANHLGSCWLGMAKLSKDIPTMKNGMKFVIMLAFGNTEERVHRTDASEFRRKSIDAISSISSAEELLEPVRLAPSASNSQPWFFSGDMNEITVSREKLNFIKAPLYGKMNQIDIGIALCHLMLSLEHQGKTGIVDFNKNTAPNGYEFMVKVKVKNA